MSQEIRPHTFTVDEHPDEDQLLLALERELSPQETARVEQHLGNCWTCRARYGEMERGILAFMEYREKVYLPLLPAPPEDSTGFRGRLRQTARETAAPSLGARLWRRIVALFMPGPVRWVSAVATGMAAVLFWMQVLVEPARVSATELLTRAVAAQNPASQTASPRGGRVARQKIRISDGKETVVREFGWRLDRAFRPAPWDRQAAPSMWRAPLTAQAFAEWRESLVEKSDQVKRSGETWILSTLTKANDIREARLVVRAADFHPVAQHIRFADDRRLDFEELAFQIREERLPEVKAKSTVAPRPVATIPAPVAPPDLDEVELQLRYTLFSRQWDQGEELAIGQQDGAVFLSGTVSSQKRQEEMRAGLSGLSHVRLAIDVAAGFNPPDGASAAGVAKQAQTLPPLLQTALDNAFAAREERLAFIERALDDSDAALSRAWALKRLVERYGEAEERKLRPESAAKLHEMLREHVRQLSRSNAALEPVFSVAPTAPTAVPAMPGDWRGRILALFTATQQQDRAIASLLVGSRPGGPGLDAAVADLRSSHQTVDALLGGLEAMVGSRQEK